MTKLSAEARLLQEREASERMVTHDMQQPSFDPDLQSGEQDVMFALIEHSSEKAVRVTEVLERLKQGTRERCAACERKIPKARLEALPTAVHCVECAREVERGRVVEVLAPAFDEPLSTTDDDGSPEPDDETALMQRKITSKKGKAKI